MKDHNGDSMRDARAYKYRGAPHDFRIGMNDTFTSSGLLPLPFPVARFQRETLFYSKTSLSAALLIGGRTEMPRTAPVYIGTSGWVYSDWKERFYPANLPSKKLLGFYSSHFATTEVNYSFYHIPRSTTYRNWAAQVPEGFVFAVKAHRSITHILRLKDTIGVWQEFIKNALELGVKLGPVLFQLPPSLRADAPLLEGMLSGIRDKALMPDLRVAFEFRHASWFKSGVLDLMRAYNASLVMAHSKRFPLAPNEATADFVYIRLHGPGQMFASTYSAEELASWAQIVRRWANKGKAVYIYFNNDFHAGAVNNALALSSLLSSLGIA